MTLFAKRVLLPAALVTLATEGAWAGATPRQIQIQCDHSTQHHICDGLRAAIADRFPDHQVIFSDAEPGKWATVLQLVARQGRADELAGYLKWTTADGQSGQSRELRLSVMDTALTRDMQREFGAHLASFFPSEL